MIKLFTRHKIMYTILVSCKTMQPHIASITNYKSCIHCFSPIPGQIYLLDRNYPFTRIKLFTQRIKSCIQLLYHAKPRDHVLQLLTTISLVQEIFNEQLCRNYNDLKKNRDKMIISANKAYFSHYQPL